MLNNYELSVKEDKLTKKININDRYKFDEKLKGYNKKGNIRHIFIILLL